MRVRNSNSQSTSACGFSPRLLLRLLSGSWSFSATTQEREVLVIVLITLARSFDAVSDLFLGTFQRLERLHYNGLYWISNGLLSLIGVAASVKYGIAGASAAYMLGSALAFVGVALPLHRHVSGLSVTITKEMRLSSLFRRAVPLGVVALVTSLNANIPRYYLATSVGSYGLGIFAALASLLTVGATVVSAMSQALSPRMAADYVARERKPFIRVLTMALIFGVVFGALWLLAAVVLGETILDSLFGPDYAGHQRAFVLVMSAAALCYVTWFLNAAMTALRRLQVQVPLFLTVALTSLLTCHILVPRYGVAGAAMSMNVSILVQLIGSAVITLDAIRAERWKEPLRRRPVVLMESL